MKLKTKKKQLILQKGSINDNTETSKPISSANLSLIDHMENSVEDINKIKEAAEDIKEEGKFYGKEVIIKNISEEEKRTYKNHEKTPTDTDSSNSDSEV